MEKDLQKTILIGGVGLSPAVLTNTVWALAHEKEPIIPDEVVAITTLTGRRCIEEQLIASKGWNRLVQTLEIEGLAVKDKLAFGASDSIRILGDGKTDYDDIATPEQNDVAADFILKVLRQYTEDPGTRVIASIAGGRKSMSALIISCMSLLGRAQDRVCHVLANDEYIFKNKKFLFPETKAEEQAAEIQLSDIPFVRVRGWYEAAFNTIPPSYMQLVNQVQGIAPKPANYPTVTLRLDKGTLEIGDQFVSLSPAEFTLVYLMLNRIKADVLPRSWYDLEPDLSELLSQNIPTSVSWFHTFKDAGTPDPEDFRKWASSARSKLRKVFTDPALADMLLPSMKQRGSHAYPAEKIVLREMGR